MGRALVRRRWRRRSRRPTDGGGSDTDQTRIAGVRAGVADRLRAARDGRSPDEAEANRIGAEVAAGRDTPATVTAAPAAAAQAKATPGAPSPGASGSGGGAGSLGAGGVSAGSALSAPLRARFGAALPGLDGVRIDTSPAAHRLTARLGALAVTEGRRIAFAPGAYAPGSKAGDRLLGHELVHTVQQARSGPARQRAPADKTASHGDVYPEGGLIGDGQILRANVIVGAGDTLTAIAARLLPYWTTSEAGLPDPARAALPAEIRTGPGLAKALMVYNAGYLNPPDLPGWRAGLRLPLPMQVAPDGSRVVNLPRAALWMAAFDAAWTPALTKAAGKAVPLAADPGATPFHLGIALLTNAQEAAPAVLAALAAGDAAAAAWAVEFLRPLVTVQIDVLNAQAPGRTVLARLRAVMEAQPEALAALDPALVRRAGVLLNAPFAPVETATLRDVALAFKARPGNLCMEACYVRLGTLHGDASEASVRREVARRDALTAANTDNVIAIMQVLQDKGLAGPPVTLTQATFDADFDRDPEAEIDKVLSSAGNLPGFYFFGMSVVTGYHTVILAIDNRDPGNRGLYWLDQNFKVEDAPNWAGHLAALLKEYAKNAEEASLESLGRSYGRYETQLWPIYPPPRLVLPAR